MQTVNTFKQTTFVVSDTLVQQAKHIARWASDWWYAREREREAQRHAHRQLRRELKKRGHQLNDSTRHGDDDVISDEAEDEDVEQSSEEELAVQLMRDVMEGKAIIPNDTETCTSPPDIPTFGDFFLVSEYFGSMSPEDKQIMSHLMADQHIKHQLHQQIKQQDDRDQSLRKQLMEELTQRTRKKQGSLMDSANSTTESSGASTPKSSSARPLPCAAPVYDTAYFAAAPSPSPQPQSISSSFSSISPSPSLDGDEYDLLSSPAKSPSGTPSASIVTNATMTTPPTSTSTASSSMISPVSSIRRVSAPPAAPVIIYSPVPTSAANNHYDPYSMFSRPSSTSISTSTTAATSSSSTTTSDSSKSTFSFPSFATAQQYFTTLTSGTNSTSIPTTTTTTATHVVPSSEAAPTTTDTSSSTTTSFFKFFSRNGTTTQNHTTTTTSATVTPDVITPLSDIISPISDISIPSTDKPTAPDNTTAPSQLDIIPTTIATHAIAIPDAPVMSSSPDVPTAPDMVVGSGIPPPPCAPDMSAPSAPCAPSPAIVEGEKLKKIHWEKLDADRIQPDSMWSRINKISLDRSHLSKMFAVPTPSRPIVTSDVASNMAASARQQLKNKGKRITRRKNDDSGEPPMDMADISSDDDETPESNAKTKKKIQQKPQLIPPLRVQNVEIGYNQLKMTPETIRDYCLFRLESQTRAIQQAQQHDPSTPPLEQKEDADPLSRDKLEILVKIAPTDDEVSVMKRYKGDHEQLNNVEKFFRILSVIPRVKRRVELLLFRRESDELLRDISRSLSLVESAYTQLKSSTHLMHVLEYVLAVGNEMNAGTHQGQAYGFRLSLLGQLTSTKANPEPGKSSSLTLLHYVVDQVDSEHGGFIQDLSDIPAAASIEMNVVANELASLNMKIKQVQEELTFTEPTDPFHWLMSTFIQQLEYEHTSLRSRYDTCLNHTDDLVRYFAERDMRWEQIYGIFRDFINSYINARKDNERYAQQQKEIQARKAKTSGIKNGGSPRRISPQVSPTSTSRDVIESSPTPPTTDITSTPSPALQDLVPSPSSSDIPTISENSLQ